MAITVVIETVGITIKSTTRILTWFGDTINSHTSIMKPGFFFVLIPYHAEVNRALIT